MTWLRKRFGFSHAINREQLLQGIGKSIKPFIVVLTSLEKCDIPTAFFDCLVPCDHCFLLGPSNSFFIWCLDLLLYSLSTIIWELECSLCLVEGELCYQYWVYVAIASTKLFIFQQEFGKEEGCISHVGSNKPYKIRENYISCKISVTGSSIMSLALWKRILEQFLLFLKTTILLFLNC